MSRSGSHWLQGFVTAVHAGRKTLSSRDGNPVPRSWTHVTKVDPEEAKRLPLLYPLYLQYTDAVSVGGSSDVTQANSEETFDLLEAVAPPAFHEPSEARHVTDRTRKAAAFLAVPEVLNGDSAALVGTLGEAVEYLREEMIPDLLEEKLPWPLPRLCGDPLAEFLTTWLLDQAVFEAYIIQNPDSAAARRGGVGEDDLLTPTEARQRAMAADRHLDSELVYLEYSGTYGGEEAEAILDQLGGRLTRARVWYGGGIDDRRKAERMLDAGADTVVVGNVFHEVAAEEATVCTRAREALGDDPAPDAVREWVADEVAVEDSAAARYLRTIPAVEDPEAVAERFLAGTVGLYLGLASETSGTAVADALDRKTRADLDAALADDVDVEEFLAALVAGDPVGDDGLPTQHLSVFERAETN